MDGDRMISLAEGGLSRRGALKATATGAALGTTFALSVQPVQAQTMITTPTDGLTAGTVKVKSTPDGAGLASESFSQSKVFGGVNLNFGLANVVFEGDKTGKATSYGMKFGLRF